MDICYNGSSCIEEVKKVIEEGVEENYYRIIFMDVSMPLMDGITATELIKKMTRNNQALDGYFKIAVLTAFSDISDEKSAVKAGADYYATKPLKMRQLIEIVKSLLAQN